MINDNYQLRYLPLFFDDVNKETKMKKKTLIFVMLIIVSIVMIFLGFVWNAAASVPFQDSELVSASAFDDQARKLLIGKSMMLIGGVLLTGSIIWRFIVSRKITHDFSG